MCRENLYMRGLSMREFMMMSEIEIAIDLRPGERRGEFLRGESDF